MIKIFDYFKRKQPEFLFLTIITLLFFILKESNYLSFINFNIRLIIFVIWIFAVLLLKLSSRESLILGLASLLLSSFFMMVKIEGWIIRTGGYTYFFLFIGLVQLWVEYFKDKNKG